MYMLCMALRIAVLIVVLCPPISSIFYDSLPTPGQKGVPCFMCKPSLTPPSFSPWNLMNHQILSLLPSKHILDSYIYLYCYWQWPWLLGLAQGTAAVSRGLSDSALVLAQSVLHTKARVIFLNYCPESESSMTFRMKWEFLNLKHKIINMTSDSISSFTSH